MKKLQLMIDALEVVSFQTEPVSTARGTVAANQVSQPPSGGYTYCEWPCGTGPTVQDPTVTCAPNHTCDCQHTS